MGEKSSFFKLPKLGEFFDSQDTIKAILMGVAVVVPVVWGVRFDALPIGIHITLGVFFASASDINGSVRLKTNGMILATLLAMLVTLVIHFLSLPLLWFIPVLGLIVFLISYLSVYGFRASLISFSGLFAIVLSLSSVSDSEMTIWFRLLLIGIGGLWYILLVLLRHSLFPKNATEYQLSEALILTAQYLEIRSKLIDKENDRRELLKDLIDLQTRLTENHETLRELLLHRRKLSGNSSYQARRLMVFIQLIDMLELAMANPVDYAKTDEIFDKYPEQLHNFQELMLSMKERLELIAEHISHPEKIKYNLKSMQLLSEIGTYIADASVASGNESAEEWLILTNYWKYQNSQLDKIVKIERLLRNNYRVEYTGLEKSELDSFLTRKSYDLNMLVDNFNIRSGIFRHSVRIALVAMAGYSLGILFDLVNAYWILLTVIVIMRPNYGLTKQRFKERSIGTVIGGVFSLLVVVLIPNQTLFAILCLASFVIGFSMVHKKYKAASAFFTIYVIFVYALLQPAVFEVIQFRVLDTLVGAGVALAGNLLLWPSWEIQSMDKTLKANIKAYMEFLKEISASYNKKRTDLTDYKLARKNAFLSFSDLSASFQRMTQEPKKQHENLDGVFRIVMLMHSFLASLSSMGAYITHHPTTPASDEFNTIVDAIEENLLYAIEILEEKKNPNLPEIETGEAFVRMSKRDLQVLTGKNAKAEDIESAEEEVHLILGQLKWLMSNSRRIPGILEEINFHH